jgi:putrescine transport system permease protein
MPVGMSVRPERVRDAREARLAFNWARGVVTNIAYMGSYSLYHVKLPSGKTVCEPVELESDARRRAAWRRRVRAWSPASGVVLTHEDAMIRTSASPSAPVSAGAASWRRRARRSASRARAVGRSASACRSVAHRVLRAAVRAGVQDQLRRPGDGIPPYTSLVEMKDGAVHIVLQLSHYAFLLQDDLYIATYLSSLKMAAMSTLLCLLIGYPMAYYIARGPATRNVLMMAVMLPFWTSFLIRVYAWIGILKNNGLLNNALIVDRPDPHAARAVSHQRGRLYRDGVFVSAVPRDAAVRAPREDGPALLEAAYDLGARPWKAFVRSRCRCRRTGSSRAACWCSFRRSAST